MKKSRAFALSLILTATTVGFAQTASSFEGMVLVPAGTFTMGSPSSEPEREPLGAGTEAQHQVTLSAFYLGKYEVTVGEFRAFVAATGYKSQAEREEGGLVFVAGSWTQKADASWRNPYFAQGETSPVVLVSWFDAVEYCNWRSKAEGLSPAYAISGTTVTLIAGANGYRLPTEAEWEYACRAGTSTPFSFGSSLSSSQANFDGNYPYGGAAKGPYLGKTSAVGSYAPNAWGLYDMHGNVWEWCWDWYGTYSASAQTNPAGAVAGASRVFRGGGWSNSGQYLRSAYRYGDVPGYWNLSLGFRLVRLP